MRLLLNDQPYRKNVDDIMNFSSKVRMCRQSDVLKIHYAINVKK